MDERGSCVFSCVSNWSLYGLEVLEPLPVIIGNVSRPPATLFLAIVVLASCRNENRNRNAVQEAILHRLQASTGLDLKSLDVTTASVSFEKNLAYATVAFHPKNDPSITGGMTMKYTLEERNGKWVVVNVADSQGHGLGGHGASGASQLPAGHPPIDGAAPAAAGGASR
jgi:hypothetical protein